MPRERLVNLEGRDHPKAGGFTDIIGQETTIGRLKDFAALYSQASKPPGHILLTGPEGIGKRTLARAFVAECFPNSTEADTKAIVKPIDLLGKLTNLGEGDAFLLKGVSKAPKAVIEMLQDVLDEFKVDVVLDKGLLAKTISIPIKRFTFVATATSKTECPPKLIESFHLILPLQSYSQLEMLKICDQLAKSRGIAITKGVAELICQSSADTPHHVAVLIDRLTQLGRVTVSEDDLALLSSVLGLATSGSLRLPDAQVEELSGTDFEKVIASLLQLMGFHTELTQATGDGGVDIVANLDRPLVGGRYLIQCKRFGPGNLVGAATVRDFYGALTADRKAIKGIIITTSGFTTQALEFARQLPIELIGGQELRNLLAKYARPADGAANLDPSSGSKRTLFDS